MITVENARAMAKASLAKRLENAAKMREAAAIAEKLSVVVGAQAEVSEMFKLQVLNRVRKQIESILQSLEDEKDADAVDKLCRSLDKLMEQERKLSGRPLPGSYRPEPPVKRRFSSSTPVLDMPSLVVSSAQLPTQDGLVVDNNSAPVVGDWQNVLF